MITERSSASFETAPTDFESGVIDERKSDGAQDAGLQEITTGQPIAGMSLSATASVAACVSRIPGCSSVRGIATSDEHPGPQTRTTDGGDCT